MNISIEEAIKQATPGTMSYGRVFIDTGWYTALFIREDPAHIAAIGQAPKIQLRAGTIQESEIYLVVLMIKLRGELYECWFNYHQQGESQKYLADLISQAELPILFYNRATCARTLKVNNPWREFAQKALDILQHTSPWSMSTFDIARQKVYQRYPRIKDLWQFLY